MNKTIDAYLNFISEDFVPHSADTGGLHDMEINDKYTDNY